MNRYRWNLFSHNFEETAFDLQAQDASSREHHLARCYDLLMASGMDSESTNCQFDYRQCHGYDMSPCDSNVARRLEDVHANYSPDKALHLGARQKIRDNLKNEFPSAVVILGPENVDCNVACEQQGKRCIDRAMLLANDCETMMRLKPGCQCTAWEFYQFNNNVEELPGVLPVLSQWRDNCVTVFDNSMLRCDGMTEPQTVNQAFCTCVE